VPIVARKVKLQRRKAESTLALWLPFNEGGGSIAYDRSRYRLNGMIYNATWATGFTANALSFNGSTGRVDVGSVLDFAGKSPFSLMAWVYPTAIAPNARMIVNKYGNDGWLLGIDSIAQAELGRFVGGTADFHISNATFSLNSWAHVAGTYDGSKLRVYLNGVLAPNPVSDTRTKSTNSNPLRIGMRSDASTSQFQGKIERVRVYSRALSSNEITNLFNEGN
jgi:hypothetical protein